MKKRYIKPIMWMENIELPKLLAGSGNGLNANDQNDPGIGTPPGSRVFLWDDDIEENL